MKMRNKKLPKLLRALAHSEYAKENGFQVIFNEAAIELNKLDTIEELINSIAASKDAVLEIINDGAK